MSWRGVSLAWTAISSGRRTTTALPMLPSSLSENHVLATSLVSTSGPVKGPSTALENQPPVGGVRMSGRPSRAMWARHWRADARSFMTCFDVNRALTTKDMLNGSPTRYEPSTSVWVFGDVGDPKPQSDAIASYFLRANCQAIFCLLSAPFRINSV